MTPKDLRERAREFCEAIGGNPIEYEYERVAAFAQEIADKSVKHFEKTLTKEDRTGLAALFGFEAGERNSLDRAKKAERRVKVLEEALAEAVQALTFISVGDPEYAQDNAKNSLKRIKQITEAGK